MGTRADHQITPQLSVRYDYHGGPASRLGPVQVSMERTPVCEDGPHTTSVLMLSELTREQAGELLKCLQHAIELWDERVKGGVCDRGR
jgi:hypothetical protein